MIPVVIRVGRKLELLKFGTSLFEIKNFWKVSIKAQNVKEIL